MEEAETNPEIKDDNDEEMLSEFNFKILVIGSSKVGKSSLLKYEITNTFSESYEVTLVLAHSVKSYNINEKKIKLQIWDTCGEESYNVGVVVQGLLNSTYCVFCVFSLDDENSFHNIDKSINEIKNNKDIEQPIIILVGNKSDCQRKISESEISEYYKNKNIIKYFETSAKTGENVHEMFEYVVKELYLKFIEPIINDKQKKIMNDINNKSDFGNYYKEGSCIKCACNIQ